MQALFFGVLPHLSRRAARRQYKQHTHAQTPAQIEYGGQCHISGRPYTVFRWRPGNDARYKKTIICQEVAKAKNVCQVCVFFGASVGCC